MCSNLVRSCNNVGGQKGAPAGPGDPAAPGTGDRVPPLRTGRPQGADPEGGGPDHGYLPVLHLKTGKADSAKAAKRIFKTDKLRLIFLIRYGIIDTK